MARIAWTIVLLWLLSSSAYAEKRVALVIGNSAYARTPALTNPTNDATDIADALKEVGFVVTRGLNLDKRAMERTIRDFSAQLSDADVALFFYAGHGLRGCRPELFGSN